MGIFDRFFGGRRQDVARNYMGGNASVMLPRYTTPPERNTQEWFRMFGQNPRMAVVDRIASDLSTCAGKLFRVDPRTGEEAEILEHPFLDFMAHPNPLYEMTPAACWRLLQIYLELKGEGYFLYEFDALGRPVELWPLPSNWVQETPYIGHPFYEIRTTGGLVRQIPVDDVFCMKDLNPLDPYRRGLGIAEALADEIEIDEYAAKFQKRFFFNDATPTTIITMPGSKPEQRRRFREEWREQFQGPHNSHGVATVDGEITVNKLAENMRDMDMVQGREFIRNAVLEHFGVPREIMGITESSNRATSEAAQYIYAQNVIMPRLRKRQDAINLQILPFFGEGLVWRFDDVVPRSQEFDKAKGIDGWNAGLLTKDEARELLGMEPCAEGGDIYKVTISDVFVHGDEDPAEVTSALMGGAGDGMDFDMSAEDDPDDPPEDEITIEDEAKGGPGAQEYKVRPSDVARLMEAAQRAQGAKFEVATMKYFRKQREALAHSLGGQGKADWSVWDSILPYIGEGHTADPEAWAALGEAAQQELVGSFVAGLLNWPAEQTTLESVFKPLWKQTYDAGTSVAKKVYAVRGVERPELISPAKLRGGQRVTKVTQTTKDNIRDIVTRCIEQGTSREDMAAEILQEYEIDCKSRARLIADQETAMCLEQGHFDMMKASGAKWKVWHHRAQKNPRDGRNKGPNHVAMEGERVPIDGVFSNGLRFPCDPTGPAKETIKCRCYLTYER